jgi:P-type Cu+ transporter
VTVTPTNVLTLDVGGMSCGSCAARIERKLNKLDGVEARVNFATEQAWVTHANEITPQDIIAAIEQAGYSATVRADEPAAEAETEAEDGEEEPDPALTALRNRLLVSAALAVPVIAMAMTTALQFRYWQWLSLALAAPVAVWGAWPFHSNAWKNLKHRTATMDTLISMGVLAAFGWSLYSLFFGYAGTTGMQMPFNLRPQPGLGLHHVYLEVAAGLTVFILTGRFLEHRAKRKAGSALRALLRLGAKDVTVLRDGHEVRVPIDQLAVGDLFLVRPGEKVATDGVVHAGQSAIDASLLTGESVPVEVSTGSEVVGGTINANGRLVVEARRVGADTQLAQMTQLVVQAQAGKAPVQRLADRVAAVFVPIVIVLAAVTLGGWLALTADVQLAFTAAVSVLVIACPCALGLATPTALLVGTGRAAQLGILIKGPEILESTRRIDTVLLDKTGTVTTGRMRLADVVAAPGEDEQTVLQVAGSLERHSEHPIGRAIAAAMVERGITPLEVDQFDSTKGLGVRGVVDDSKPAVGRRTWLTELGNTVPAELEDSVRVAEESGRTVVFVAWDEQVRGVLTLADAPKPTSADAVAELKSLGLSPALLTGDNERAARAIAHEVGVHEVFADVLPEGKIAAVKRLQASGKVVAVVGDGVNDAAALAQADLGLAMGTGTDAAIEASDITLVRGDLRAAAEAIQLSRRTLRTIKGNLFWAFAYNVAAIPLAAFGLLNPMIAGAAMAASSVFVVTNSLRLRKFTPKSLR